MRLKPSIPLQSMSFGDGKQPMEHEKKVYVSLCVVRSGETERGEGRGCLKNFTGAVVQFSKVFRVWQNEVRILSNADFYLIFFFKFKYSLFGYKTLKQSVRIWSTCHGDFHDRSPQSLTLIEYRRHMNREDMNTGDI